jgi:hypothetical protein
MEIKNIIIDMKSKLDVEAEMFETLCFDKYNLSEKAEQLKRGLEVFENKLKVDIFSETDENGKKKYSNDESRKIELKHRMGNIEDCNNLNKEIIGIEKELFLINTKLEITNKRIFVYAKQVELYSLLRGA